MCHVYWENAANMRCFHLSRLALWRSTLPKGEGFDIPQIVIFRIPYAERRAVPADNACTVQSENIATEPGGFNSHYDFKQSEASHCPWGAPH